MTQSCQRGKSCVEIKAYLLSTYEIGENNSFSYIEELKLVKFKNNRYMWKTINTTLAKFFFEKDNSIQIFLKHYEVSRFGAFYYFKEEHLDKKKPFWDELWTHIV